MRVEHDAGAAAFTGALRSFVTAVAELSDEDLLVASRCRGWSRLDAVVHVHLGLQEMLTGLVSPTDAEPDVDAVTYWQIDLPSTDDSADAIDQLGFLHRLSSAYRRPRGAIGHLRVTADAIGGAAERLPEGRVRLQGHVLTTGDLLGSWAVELAVHHLDLDVGPDATAPDPAAVRLARATAEALSGAPIRAASDTDAVLRGWGRG